MGVSVLLRLSISSNEVCNTAPSSVYMSHTKLYNGHSVIIMDVEQLTKERKQKYLSPGVIYSHCHFNGSVG